jgi:GNAT superfamily N-acetyltransferase
MLSRMPFSVRGYRAVYIYGVATRPDHRGRGLAGSLIMEALKTPGADIAALVPERPELAGFYGRFGFAPRGRLPRDGRLLMIKHLRGAAPDEEVCAGLAGLIQIFEDSPED